MLETPVRDRKAERRKATRDEILDAAWELVRANGLAALSLRDLAQVVGMKAPSLYSYFESKYAIYDAMFAQGAEAYLDTDATVPVTGDHLADLQVGVRYFIEFCTSDPARYQLMFQRTIPGFEPSAETFALAVEGLERLRTRLARADLTDQRSLDLLTAIGSGIAAQQIANDPGGDRWTRLVDEATEMYFLHVTSTTRTPRSTT
ncbi:MAG: TetR/AcrR family transcriptional regulator [Ilumatobacteraceae bacterium]